MANELMIHGKVFPYENGPYSATNRNITGLDFWYSFTTMPEKLLAKVQAAGVISIQELAEDKVLNDNPYYLELTRYGTRKAGYWADVRKQAMKTLFWVLNNQPRSITLFVRTVDGLEFGSEKGYTVYGTIQLALLNGVQVQIVYPDTGFSRMMYPVYNKKLDPLFTKVFLCEKYLAMYNNKELLPAGLASQIDAIYDKCVFLDEVRTERNAHLFKQMNIYLSDFKDEFAEQNLLTLPERISFATEQAATEILATYNREFKIPGPQRMTLQDIKAQMPYILQYLRHYGPAFGINVRTVDTTDTTKYTTDQWQRNKKSPKNQLKEVLSRQNLNSIAPINELLEAYLQIDFYMSQPDVASFLAPGYTICECGYFNAESVEECPKCGKENPSHNPFEMMGYDTVTGTVIAPANAYESDAE